ncbi:hypothetical protein OIU77_003610 [Salix suchowensis]|uniref:Uncharacterized protein n=1 Tax=Salix suchowensis TaxID=1278906 RepID=A0ABQ9B1N1_9ROSI|nr:hypothetical protein OIU77_003610 [Salix suchowensis]
MGFLICVIRNSRHRKQSSSALASRDDQSPLRDTATFWDRQYHSNPRNIVEQPSSGSKRHALTQSPLPVAMSQWEQLLNLRLLHHHVQEGHLLSQSAMAGGGGTSLKSHPQVSNPGLPICLPDIHAFQGLNWDASSLWQLCSPCTYTVPGSYGYVFSSQPSNMPGSATSLLQSFQRGIIRTPGKLSQKHQQLWDAQKIIKERKTNEISCSVDAPPSLDKPDQIQAQARKSEPCKGQPEARAHIFEEVVLYKNKKNSKMLPNNMISNDYMAGDPSIASEVFSKETNNIDNKGALATYLGEMNKRNLAWPCIISAKDSAKDVLKISSEAFYNNGSVIQQVGNFIPGWSLMMNGEDASNEFADGLVALSKDENEEEMNWRWVFLLGNFTFPLDNKSDNKSSVLLFGSAVDEVDDEKSAQLGPQRFVQKINFKCKIKIKFF